MAGMGGTPIPSVAGTTNTQPLGSVSHASDNNHNHNNNNNNNKKSWCRRAAPCLAFLAAFSTAMALLLIWSEAVALRRQAFDANMTRDYVLDHVSMDNPVLVEYIREVQFKRTTRQDTLNTNQTADEKELMPLIKGKHNGVYLEYISRAGASSTTSWLEAKYGWHGVLVLTDFRSYFEACRSSRHPTTRVIHACLSTDRDTKEITYHQEAEVRVTKLGEGGPNSIIFSEEGPPTMRLKCFPLYTVLLAYNKTTIDYLNLDSTDSNDALVLDTIPWDIIRIGILSIRWSNHHSEAELKSLVDKLSVKRYRYVQTTETGKLIFAYSRVKI